MECQEANLDWPQVQGMHPVCCTIALTPAAVVSMSLDFPCRCIYGISAFSLLKSFLFGARIKVRILRRFQMFINKDKTSSLNV